MDRAPGAPGAVMSLEAGRHCPGADSCSESLPPSSHTHPHMPLLTFRPVKPWNLGRLQDPIKISRAGNGSELHLDLRIQHKLVFHPMWGLMLVPAHRRCFSPVTTGPRVVQGLHGRSCGRERKSQMGFGSQSHPTRETEAGLPIVGGAH